MTSKDWVSAEKQDKNSDQIDVPQLRFPGFNDEWKTYKLGDFLSFYSTNSFSRSKLNYKSGTVKNIHYGDIHTNYPPILNCNSNKIPYINNNIDLSKFESASYLKDGDLIIADASEDYDDIGKAIEVVNVGDKKILSGLHTILARDENNRTVNGFKSYLFLSESIRHNLKVIANGISVLGISKTNLSKIEVKIPSLSEQQKIVELFNLIQEKIILMEKKYQFIKKYKMGLMQKIFSQEINFKGEDKELEVKKIGDYLIESKIVGEDKINKRLTVKLNLKGVYPRDTTTVEKIGATKQYIRKAGQFIYGKQNLFKGAFGIVPDYLDGYLSSSDIPSFDFKKNINPIWFYYYFSRESFYRKLEDLSTGTGSKRVSPNDFLKIKITIPSLKEQNEIADFLSKIDNKIDSVEQQLEKIKEFKKYLLQQMFV